jgi:DNA-binding response OmpR family regulator
VQKTILVVDDDFDFSQQQKLQLEAAGFNVLLADSQRRAEEMLSQTRPDAAVVDLMMEYKDSGFALCYHIKKKDSSIPVILVTAVTSETGLEFDAATEEERSWVKADAMLAKPLRFEQLLAELHQLLKE